MFRMICLMISPFLLIAWSPAAYAEPYYGASGETVYALQEWLTQADAGWQISFPYTSSGAGSGTIESELNFKRIDSPITVLRGITEINPEWSMDLTYGVGRISEGRGTDTDRYIPSTGGEVVFSESRQDISGEVRMWDLNLFWKKESYQGRSAPIAASIGFLHYEDRLRLRNGIQTIPSSGPFTGLDSTFYFNWNALKLGTALDTGPIGRFLFHGLLSLYPYVRYKGEGFWNLRAIYDPVNNPDPFSADSPNFIQKDSSGYGGEAALGVSFRITGNAQLSAGYRYLYLAARGGTHKLYFADGTVTTSRLDWAETARHGAYAGFALKF